MKHLLRSAGLCLALGFLGVAPFPAEAATDENLFESRRAGVLPQFDANKDGRLDASEREAMRSARKQKAARASARPGMMMPPELVKEYDKNGDGELDEQESADAREGIRVAWEKAQKDYDKDGNGELSEAERETMASAISEGKIKGLPRFLGMMARGGPPGGRRGPGGRGGAPDANDMSPARFDVDKDGRLDEAELRAARAARGAKPAPVR